MQPGNNQLEPAAGLFLLLFQEHPDEFPGIGFAALAPGVIAEAPGVSVVSQHIKLVVADSPASDWPLAGTGCFQGSIAEVITGGGGRVDAGAGLWMRRSQHIKLVVADKLPQPEAFGGYLHFGDRVTVIGIRWPVGVGSNRGDERIRPTVSVEGRIRKLQMLLHRTGNRRCEGPRPGWWW